MNIQVCSEYRFDRTPDGSVWTETMFPHSFWNRYLCVFDQVSVVARVREVPEVSAHFVRADGYRVSFIALPYYLGPLQYLANGHRIRQICRSAVSETDALILRVPSILANTLLQSTPKDRPYGVEVVGDPHDVFAPSALKHPLRALFRRTFSRMLQRQCKNACAAAYVTGTTLQRRYPPNTTAYSTFYSSINLRTAACVDRPRTVSAKGRINIVIVGSLAQPYKAVDILLRALHQLVRGGLDLSLTVVGDGQYRKELEDLSQILAIEEKVCFLGQLPAGEAIWNQLDSGDLFVLPSRTEGLPRAMIEAMARAMPCIGTTVGGIPELLAAEDMVPPNDVGALAAKIREVVTDLDRMSRMSSRNLKKAQEYTEDILSERRTAFYQYVRRQTEAWSEQQRRQANGGER